LEVSTLIQTIANSLVQSSVYATLAIGLALGFGVMKMANFAHGEFYMLGAYVVFFLYTTWGLPYPLAVLAALPIIALVGMLTERLIFRPTKGNVLAGFMATAGLTFILQVLVGQAWGVGLMRAIETPYKGAWEVAGAFIGWQRLIIIPVAILMITALWYFLYHVKIGKALRACAQDPEVAALQGISINKITLTAMAIAGGYAGIAGALMAPIQPVTPYMGHDIIIICFIIVIVGGMESIAGAVLASFILGFIHTFMTTLYDSIVAIMAGVALMALILIVKPEGLLGKVKA
jgi:branched-chain amino acid transport system permease protein